MGGYEVCQHCSNAVHASRAVLKDGYSYHRKCRKCYVCSETNLHDAEVFRGVIFCSSCAKRIFRGCATARSAKQPARRRGRRMRDLHGVIERARAAPSTSSCSSSPRSKPVTAVPAGEPRVNHDCYCVSDVVTQARRLINYIYYQTQNLVRHEKVDNAQCSEACKRMLDDLCPLPDLKTQASSTASQPRLTRRNSTPLKISSDCNTSHSHSRFKSKERKSKKMKKDAKPCSDLRIAELGASIEIANMALRTTSTKKVQSGSKVTPKAEEPETFSTFSETETATSNTSNEEYLDSECQEYRGSNASDGGRRIFARIMKRPFKMFKKNIIERSSLISVIAGIETERNYRSAFKCLKTLFHDEVLDHHYDGYKKLYSTINKKKMPYKLGWLETDEIGDRKTSPCRHYAECHSYRCMREQVMKVAGPTRSKMHVCRNKMKKTFVPFFKKKTKLVEHSTQSSSLLIPSRLQERYRRSIQDTSSSFPKSSSLSQQAGSRIEFNSHRENCNVKSIAKEEIVT